MALSVMINLDDLLFAAYNLGFTSDGNEPSLTKAELRAKLLANVPLVGCAESKIKTVKTPAETKTKAEKKPRETKPKAEKPVAEFCCARAFYEKDHVEDGKLKKMSDDEANEFGGRCKFKQSGESTFCKHHAEKQPHGVWGGEYAGKLKMLIEKANAPIEESKPKIKTTKKIVKKTVPVDEEPKTPTKTKTKVVKPNAPKRPAKEEESDKEEDEDDDEDEYLDGKVLESAGIEFEWIEIDDISYMIDAEGNIYDPETEEKLGEYNIKTKKWISGGPASE
jgi:hypothetical protein